MDLIESVRHLAYPAGNRRLVLVSAVLLFQAAAVSAQLIPGDLRFALRSRYGDGRENGLLAGRYDQEKKYSESRLDLDYSFGEIQAGLSMEAREPAEFTDNFTRVRKGFVQYKGGNYLLRGGTLYGLSGRGLTFNLHEDRVLDYDNTVRGFQGLVELKKLRLEGLAGSCNYVDFRSPRVIDSHTLAAVNGEYSLSPGVKLGVSALQDRLTRRKDHQSSDRLDLRADIPTWVGGSYAEGIFGPLESFVEFSWKRTGRNRRSVPEDIFQMPIRMLRLDSPVAGKGLYGSLGYSIPGLGVILEYKNYQYDYRDEMMMNQAPGPDPAGLSIFQYPPPVFKEHLYHLLNRYPVSSNFDNEIGMQIEVNAQPLDALELQGVLSVTSKADLLLTGSEGGGTARKRGGFPLVPSLDSKFNPRYDSFLDARWRVNPRLRIQGGFGYRQSTEYFHLGNFGSRLSLHTLPVEAEINWSRNFTTLLDLEAQHVHDKGFPFEREDDHYWNQFLSMGLSWAHKVSLTLSGEFSGEVSRPGAKKFWPLAALILRLPRGGTLNLSYGSQREGMICSNGVCKYLPGFKGFRSELNLFF